MSYEVGNTIGDYQIVGVLGAGGMGKVYKVRNIISDRVEAMKVLLPNLDTDTELAERFIREIKVQASLQHPNIAALRTAQRVGNQLLMIMEYVEGSTLEALMRQGRIPLRESVNYVSQVLSALSYAHAHGVVHRDIKPPNMMLTPEGVVKLMDFGIAKINVDHRLTQTGKTVGSLFYMSPEQIRGSEVDARADLYSLGVSLYEMVTGKRPFQGDSDYSIMAAHLQQPPMPPIHLDPSLPPALNDVILISIAKDAGERFQSADAFRSALQSVEKDLGVGAAASAIGTGTQLYAPPVNTPPSVRVPTQTGVPAPPTQRPPAPPSQPQMQAMPPQMMPPPPPQYQPQPPYAAAGQAQMPPPKSHRGLYMVLGSLVTIGILAGAALYLPKMFKTGAASGGGQVLEPVKTTPVHTPPVQPTPAQTTPVQTAPPVQTEPAVTTPAQTEPAQHPKTNTATAVQPPIRHAEPPVKKPPVQTTYTPPQVSEPKPPQQTPPAQVQAQMPQPGFQNPAANPEKNEIRELRQRKMLLHARVEGINSSMRSLEEQQRQMGVGMNGRLVATHRRMMFFMETAESALRSGNVAEARTSLDNAERELNSLEEHFGR